MVGSDQPEEEEEGARAAAAAAAAAEGPQQNTDKKTDHTNNMMAAAMCTHGTVSPPLLGQLTSEQKYMMDSRIVHHFLRQYGWMLADTILTAFAELASIPFMGKTKYAAAYLDLCVIKADIMMNRPYNSHHEEEAVLPRSIGVALSKVAGALEVMTKKNPRDEPCRYFQEAANLHLEAAQRYLQNTDMEDEAYCSAADCTYLALKFDTALEYMTKSLQVWGSWNGGKWDFDDEKTNTKICFLINLQLEIFGKLGKERIVKGEYQYYLDSDERILVGLVALLKAAGFEPGQQEDDQQKQALGVLRGQPQPPEMTLKPKFTNPKQGHGA